MSIHSDGGDCLLLKNTECHYSEYREKRTSIFLVAMAASSAWAGRPKGALTQTSFAVRPGLRVPAPCAGASCPCDPGQPCAGWIPGTCRRSITTKGADPLPSTPSQPCAGWTRSRKGALPPSRPIPASGFRARHHDQRGVPAPWGIPARPSAAWMPLSVSPVNHDGGLPCR